MTILVNKLEDTYARNICHDHNDEPAALLEILHIVQAKQGYLSNAALHTIADALNISRAEIHGVVSFYHDYKRRPGGKMHIKICRAEACQAVGCDDLIEKAEQIFSTKLDEPAQDIALEAVYCLGNCALGPAVMVGDKLYGRVNIEKLKTLAGNT